MSLEQVPNCDLCGSTKFKLFLKTPDRNYQTGTFNYVQCQNCKLVRLNPRPEMSEIGKYYPKIYRVYQKVAELNKLQKLIRYLIKKNNILANILIKDKLYFWKIKGKILDVGAGNSQYLGILENWGWDAYGVEINPTVVQEAKKRGIKKIKQGTLISTKYPDNYFDVVRFSHVLEHVPSPKKEIKETKRILKSNGKILIYIPNIDSVFFKIFRSNWYPLDAPRHLYQFSPNTMKRLLLDQGFSNIKISYNQSPYSLIRSLLFLVGLKRVERRFGFIVFPLGIILKVLNLLKKSDILEISAI